MAIMDCPACGKKISSKAGLCTFCGHEMGDVTEADREVFRSRRRRARNTSRSASVTSPSSWPQNVQRLALLEIFLPQAGQSMIAISYSEESQFSA